MAPVDMSPAKDEGVLKEIIREGTSDETPTSGCTVTVHYTGTLLDGTKFDSSKDRNEPFSFVLQRKYVIPAWDIGAATMKRGEIAMFTCAPRYAYGKVGNPPKIPPDATLKFEIEMIDWKGEDLSPNQDGGIERYLIVAGTEQPIPEGSTVKVHLTGMYNGNIFEDKDVEFTLGEGEAHGIVEGVDKALEKFMDGEKSRLKIKSKYVFRNKGIPEFNIPPNADIEYIVELKVSHWAVESWLLKGPEKLEQAKLYKEKGNTYFNRGAYNVAIKMYHKVTTLLKAGEDFEDSTLAERNSLLLPAHLNLGLCYLKTGQNIEAKHSCTKALELDPRSEKAYFRRGQAYIKLRSPEEAKSDFEQIIKFNPNSVTTKQQIIICDNLIDLQIKKEKKLYANMFEKFAKQDREIEEEKLRALPDVMHGALGEWGQEERPGGRDATAFEKENPNILMLNANGTGEFQNM